MQQSTVLRSLRISSVRQENLQTGNQMPTALEKGGSSLAKQDVKLKDLLDDWKLRRLHLAREIEFLEGHPHSPNDKVLAEMRGLALELDRLIAQYDFDA